MQKHQMTMKILRWQTDHCCVYMGITILLVSFSFSILNVGKEQFYFRQDCNGTKPAEQNFPGRKTPTSKHQDIPAALQNASSKTHSAKFTKSIKWSLVPRGTLTGPTIIPLHTLPNKSVKHSKQVVPKIVHYVWFYPNSRCNVRFYHFMSILSAYRFKQPKEIIIWYDNLPCGKWWKETKARVPILNLRQRDPPMEIFGKPIKVPEHRSDVARLDILLKYGGIYLPRC